jgi:hypothetical protein
VLKQLYSFLFSTACKSQFKSLKITDYMIICILKLSDLLGIVSSKLTLSLSKRPNT